MSHRKLTRLFFAGTDTGVGKTYVAAMATRQFRRTGYVVGVYKPVESGCRVEGSELIAEDAGVLWEAAGRPQTLRQVCPQRFALPLAPPQAAALAGRHVDEDQLRDGADCWTEGFDVLIIEGAGGLFSPIAATKLNIDLARDLGADVVLVAPNRLGVIHQVIATCEAAMHRGVEPRAIILSNVTEELDASAADNAAQISNHCRIPVLGTIPHLGGEDGVEFLQKLVN